MAEAHREIPIIDISCILSKGSKESDLSDVQKQVLEAVTNLGFLFVKGHGIPTEILRQTFEASRKFFKQPLVTNNFDVVLAKVISVVLFFSKPKIWKHFVAFVAFGARAVRDL